MKIVILFTMRTVIRCIYRNNCCFNPVKLKVKSEKNRKTKNVFDFSLAGTKRIEGIIKKQELLQYFGLYIFGSVLSFKIFFFFFISFKYKTITPQRL